MDETTTVEQMLETKDAALLDEVLKVEAMLRRSRRHLDRGERNYAVAVAKDAAEKLSALVG